MALWRTLLEQCAHHPGRKCVHELRVATQRLLAEAEYCLRLQKPAPKGERLLRRWRKQGKRLRRALAPLREVDASLPRLAGLRKMLAAGAEQTPSSRQCQRQALRLEASLKRQRQRAAQSLCRWIVKRQKRLQSLSRQAASLLALPMQSLAESAAQSLPELMRELAARFSPQDADSLHAFRKRVKKVRSLAVIAGADPALHALAVELRAVQAAAGEWRDWQVLAEIAHLNRAGQLALLLDARACQALQRARAQGGRFKSLFAA